MVKERNSRRSTASSVDAQEIMEVDAPLTNGKGNGHINGKQMNGTLSPAETPKKPLTEDERPLGEQVKVQKTPSGSSKRQSPSGGSQCALLTQGIMANDSAKVDSVIRNNSSDVINPTLRDLQPMHVLPLLKVIENRLKTRAAADIRPTIRWAQAAFSIHMPYLCSLPNLEKEIGGLLGWLRSRVGQQKELLALLGKISTIADQIKKRSNKVVIVQQPLIVFNNDMDSESDEFDTIVSDDDGESSEEDDWWDDNELKDDEDDDDDDDDDDADSNESDQEMGDSDNDDDDEKTSESGSGSGEEDDAEEDMEVG